MLRPTAGFAGVTYGWIEIDEDGAGHVFATASLSEEGIEGAALSEISRIGVWFAVCLQTMLEQVQPVIVKLLSTPSANAHHSLPSA